MPKNDSKDSPNSLETKLRLINLPNVEAVSPGKKSVGGVETDEDALIVYVTVKKPLTELRPEEVVPLTVGGVRTDVRESHKIRALQDPKKMYRPVQGGVSVGHPRVTAGTNGGPGRYIDTDQPIWVTNCHVAAMSGDAEIGDEYWQPARYDGGSSVYNVGWLGGFENLAFTVAVPCKLTELIARIANGIAKGLGSGSRLEPRRTFGNADTINYVDCAFVFPAEAEFWCDKFLSLGVPENDLHIDATVGRPVRKIGRTTGDTLGKVVGTNAMVRVSYGEHGMALFDKQVIIEPAEEGKPFSAGGDSGSMIFAIVDGKLVRTALLFAGSDVITIGNPINMVMDALGIDWYI